MHLDTANTVSVGKADSDVSFVTPVSAPRVLYNVVVFSITDSENGVVKVSAAPIGNDTAGVVTKHSLVSLNSNSNWTSVQGSFEVSKANRNGEVARNDSDSVGVINSAALVSRFIRVVCLLNSGVLLTVFENIVLPATSAAEVEFDAVHVLLLREGEENAVINLEMSFKSSSGRECPAGSALSLILDGSDSSAVSPVNGFGNTVAVGASGGWLELGLLVSHVLPSLHVFVLLGSHGGDLVVAEGVSALGVGVPLVDNSVGFCEQVSSEVILFDGDVGVSVASDVLHESSIDIEVSSSETSKDS